MADAEGTFGASARAPRNLAVALASLLALALAATPAFAEAPDADATEPADAESSAERHLAAELLERRVVLDGEIRALERLLSHKLLEDRQLRDLFPVDITDDDEVETLRHQLNARFTQLVDQRAPPEAPPLPDDGTTTGGDSEGATDGATDGASTGTAADTTTGDLASTTDALDATETAGTTEAAAPEPEPEPEPEPVDPLRDLKAQVLDLEIRAVEARLAVLDLPPAERERLAFEEAEHERLLAVKAEAENAAKAAEVEARLAEAARQRALEAALAARTAIQRKLAEERATAEGVRRDQAQLRGRLAQLRHDFELGRKDGDWPGNELPLKVADIEPGSPAAAALYDDLVAASENIRVELRAALINAESDPIVPRYRPDLPDAPSDAPPSIVSDIEALERTASELTAAADELARSSHTLALDVLDASYEHESELYHARIALLDRLPQDKRDAVLGLGREGIAQVERELSRLFLAARWYRIQRKSAPNRLLSSLGDIYTFARVASSAFWLLLVAGLAFFLTRRGSYYLGNLRALAIRSIKRASLIRVIQGLLAAVEAVVGQAVVLLALLVAWPTLGEAQAIPEIAALYDVLLYVAIYRLLLRAAHVGISRLIHRRLDAAVSDKILRSLKVIGRTALTIAIFLSISEQILGKGYLYRLVLGFAWLCALPIAAILIRWWRQTIADAYLKYSDGTGAMADAVRKTRGRWYGFFVTTAAVGILFVVAVIRVVRQFILGFEQSRKALAFVFRRRLERQAEDLDDARPRILPQDFVDHLTTAPVAAGPLRLDYFPKLDDWAQEFASWRHNTAVGATLVVSRPGSGKTTWLWRACDRAAEQIQCEVTRISMTRRVLTRVELLALLVEELGAPAEAQASLIALRDWLVAGPRRLVAIDDLHGLFLRGVDTNQAWDAFDDLVAATGRKVFWIATIARQPYEYLRWAYRGRGSFRKLIELSPWPEERIAELLRERTQATGFKVIYDDLVIDRVEGVEAQTQLVGTEREYARLIWDYADGSPAVALDCWRASLVTDSEACVRVRLFRRPPESVLEELGEPQRFLLASTIWHGHLTAQEAARSLRYRLDLCIEGLDLLTEIGAIAERDGRYVPTIPWLPAIYRYLRRHHLIED